MMRSAPILLLVLFSLIASACSDECCCTCRTNCGEALNGCFQEGDIWVCPADATTGNDNGSAPDSSADGDLDLLQAETLQDISPQELVQPDSNPQDATDTNPDISHDFADAPPVDADLIDDTNADLAAEVDVNPDEPSEMRGIWISRWDFSSAADIASVMEDASNWGFNTVFFQVRGAADAYYNSNVEPWAKGLSGTLGKDPGWDPLAVALQEAHSRGMELHAWVNTFPAWVGTSAIPQTTPPHVLYSHPEWRQHGIDGTPMAYNASYTWLSPGIPGVRAHVISVLVDIAQNYDVDGIHLDYIRYAGPTYSHDAPSEAAYSAAKASSPTLTWGDFQRDVLTAFVDEAYKSITAVEPSIKVTTAVWGIYKDSFGWGGTSQGFYDYFQDSHRWVQEGIVDAICPMVYWPLTTPKGGWTDFATLADDHFAASGNRHVYMGISVDYPDVNEILDEIDYIRSIEAPGTVLFSYVGIKEGGFGPAIRQYSYPTPLPVPPMPWKSQP